MTQKPAYSGAVERLELETSRPCPSLALVSASWRSAPSRRGRGLLGTVTLHEALKTPHPLKRTRPPHRTSRQTAPECPSEWRTLPVEKCTEASLLPRASRHRRLLQRTLTFASGDRGTVVAQEGLPFLPNCLKITQTRASPQRPLLRRRPIRTF